MKSKVPKADGIKVLRDELTQVAPELATSGDAPFLKKSKRSVRTKGFWRAYRRKELCFICPPSLVDQYIKLNQFSKVIPDANCGSFGYIMWPGPRGLEAWLPD